MTAKPRHVVRKRGRNWAVVDTKTKQVVRTRPTEARAQREADEWNRYNGPPVPGLASMLNLNL